jgi:N-dimethylarginine dimethylaminohydrolase
MKARETNSTTQPRFLMCNPQHFTVSYSINPWMDPHAWAKADRSLHNAVQGQWASFRKALLNEGAAIELLEPRPGLPDLVFTANAAVVLDGKALLARFRHPERQREESVFATAFHTLQSHSQIETVAKLPEDLVLEGAGDCIWDQQHGHFWMGYGQRSDQIASHVVADEFGVECIALELADPRFYHLDTAFTPLPSGDVIYYPGAFTPAARHVIEDRIAPAQRIALEPADALKFAANAVSLDHCLMLSSCTNTLRCKIEERGFTVIETPLHAFLCGGGSACCLTLRLDYRSQ